MDPDANLEEQLASARAFIKTADEAGDDFAFEPSDVVRLCELVEALDGWLSRGGFPPKRWRRKDDRGAR